MTCVSVEVAACLGLAWLALAGNTTGVPYTWTLAKQSHMAQNTKQKHTNAQITKHNWWPFHLDSKQSHTAHVWKAAECLFSNHIVVLLLAQIGAFFYSMLLCTDSYSQI